MSHAHKCDLCDKLFERELRCVSIERLAVVTEVAGSKPSGQNQEMCDAWDQLDFCPACSARILEVVGPALGGLT